MDHHKWVRLRNFKCPVSGCPGANRPTNWVCAECRAPIYISQTGYIRCDNYSRYYGYICFGHMVTWKWNCGNHGEHPYEKYRNPDIQGYILAISHALQLMEEAGAAWVGSLCFQLEQQFMYYKNW